MSVDKAGAPKRSKKASKKNKKSWRKNIDLDDVEDFLDDQRLEERLGGAFKDREDAQLFHVDKGEEEAKEEGDQTVSERLRKRREAAAKPLRCFAQLENTSAVADPKKGRNRRKKPEERENPVVKAMSQRFREQGIVK